MRTSPLESLEENTPKSYIICPHLNLQRRLQIHLRFRGLSVKLHHSYFGKGSDEQFIITMHFLAQNYPKSIYGMSNFELGTNFEKNRNLQGAFCKIGQDPIYRGANCKNAYHHCDQ